MRKQIVRFLIVSVVAMMLEIFYFNFGAIYDQVDQSIQHDISYQLTDMELQNYSEDLVSYADPMLYLYGVNTYVDDILIHIETSGATTGTLFYTTQTGQQFSAENMIVINDLTGTDPYTINKYICALRVDPGEDAGVILYDSVIVLNPSETFNISFARILAVFVIYYGFTLLFSFQKMPTYNVIRERE